MNIQKSLEEIIQKSEYPDSFIDFIKGINLDDKDEKLKSESESELEIKINLIWLGWKKREELFEQKPTFLSPKEIKEGDLLYIAKDLDSLKIHGFYYGSKVQIISIIKTESKIEYGIRLVSDIRKKIFVHLEELGLKK